MIKTKILQCMPYILVKDKLSLESGIGADDGTPPEIFNSAGEKMNIFYLKDTGNIHVPYTLSAGRYPKRILWDRFNVSLKTHFYTHGCVFGKTYSCEHKIGTFRESEEILPWDFDMAMKKPEVIREFDHILTHSERILEKYENAEFTPAGSVWYGTERYGGIMAPDNYQRKEKNISIIASDKAMCDLHKVRADIARHYKDDKRVDAYGRAVDRYIPQKSDALEKYRYSIVLENSETSYYFTEKIMDCFASMTIPVYVGATKIGQFFNEDGIIRVSSKEAQDYSVLDKIINSCTREDYESRRDAIIDNYNRVQQYLCYEDYLINKYDWLKD